MYKALSILFTTFCLCQAAYAGNNPGCPDAGKDTTFIFYPSSQAFSLLLLNGADPGGTWNPPLHKGGNAYTPCEDGEGTFTYTQKRAGCPEEVSTVTIVWLWDPCDWKIQDICWTVDGLSITMPPFPGDHPDVRYNLVPFHDPVFNLDLDSTNTVVVAPDSIYEYSRDSCAWIIIWLDLPGAPGYANYFWLYLGNYCPIPYCSCFDPPNAGEKNTIDISVNGDPFDLTMAIGGNPDLGGTWAPLLTSGGNIYDPILDGQGVFTYTVSGGDECPAASSTITIRHIDLSLSSVVESCSDNNTYSDLSDDKIQIQFTPIGYHLGTNYTVSLSSGSIVPDTGSYDVTTIFQLEAGSAGNGNVTLIVTDNASPYASFEFVIEDPAAIVLDAGPDQVLNRGEDAQLMVNTQLEIATLEWFPHDFLSCSDCPDPLAMNPDRNITYSIIATDINQCVYIDDVNLFIETPEEVYSPNIFSPNGDGINDHWTIITKDITAEILILNIYDRAGGLMFSKSNVKTNSEDALWDGTFNGQSLNPGVYVYYSNIKLGDGHVIPVKGDVTIVR